MSMKNLIENSKETFLKAHKTPKKVTTDDIKRMVSFYVEIQIQIAAFKIGVNKIVLDTLHDTVNGDVRHSLINIHETLLNLIK